jgi:hypothetical protein
VGDFWREIATNQVRLTPSEDALVWRLRGENMPWDKIERRIKNTRAIVDRECFGPGPETILRACLMCRDDFRAVSKFQRMCERCRKRAA